MRGSVPADQLLFDPEIERTARRLNSKTRRRRKLAKERRLAQEATTSSATQVIEEEMAGNGDQDPPPPPPPRAPCANSPRRAAQFARNDNNARNSELKTGILQLLYTSPFAGLDHEDPYTHLAKFYEIVGAVGAPEREEEQVFKRLFPHSLIGKAKDWYLDQPTQTMTNWNELEKKFLDRFFPQSRLLEAKTAISVFSQGVNETLNEAWERYKSMLRKCPSHGFDELTQIHIFRNGLQPQPKLLLDATAGGSLMAKTAEEAIEIIEKMARNDHQVQHNRGVVPKKPGLIELGTNDAILAQNKLLSQQVEELTKQMARLPQQLKELNDPNKNKQVASCELCSGDHPTGYCPPVNEVNYMANQNQGGYQQRQAPYQNQGGYQQRPNAPQYGQGWRQDNYQQRQSPYQQQPPSQDKPSKLEETLNQFMQASMANQKSNEAAIKNLETQVGQLAKQLAEKQTGPSFTANTQTNPKEHCKAVVTRSGRVLESEVEKEVEEEEVRIEKEKEMESEVEPKKNEGVLVENESEEKSEEEEEKNREKKRKIKEGKKKVMSPPVRNLPYPRAPSKKDNEKQYARFLDIFRQLQINIPFGEALEQMPKYAKFMKDILTKKRSYTEPETVVLDAKCSAIIQSTLPKKERDPGRVTLPVTIGDIHIGRGLVDTGSSINLIPLSMVKRLGIVDMKNTRMTLQLADKSTTMPFG